MTQEEIDSFQEAFNNFDKDKNGFITKKEIKKVVKKCGSKIKTKEIEKMVSLISVIVGFIS